MPNENINPNPEYHPEGEVPVESQEQNQGQNQEQRQIQDQQAIGAKLLAQTDDDSAQEGVKEVEIAGLSSFTAENPEDIEALKKYFEGREEEGGKKLSRLASEIPEVSKELEEEDYSINTYFENEIKLGLLRQKMQNEEDLTKEELEFLYAANTGAESTALEPVDREEGQDPVIEELKLAFDAEYALNKGLDVYWLMWKMGTKDVVDNINVFIDHGASADDVICDRLGSYQALENLDTLVKGGFVKDVNDLATKLFMNPYDERISESFFLDEDEYEEWLEDKGSYYETLSANKIRNFAEHGADINKMVGYMNSDNILEELEDILNIGVSANVVARGLLRGDKPDHPDYIDRFFKNIDKLVKYGYDVNDYIWYWSSPRTIDKYMDTLLKYGYDANKLISGLKPSDGVVEKRFDVLLAHGADINNLVLKLGSRYVAENFDSLLARGADINNLASAFSFDYILKNFDSLLARGVDSKSMTDKLAEVATALGNRLSDEEVSKLRACGVNV